jgi:hypothetical protein
MTRSSVHDRFGWIQDLVRHSHVAKVGHVLLGRWLQRTIDEAAVPLNSKPLPARQTSPQARIEYLTHQTIKNSYPSISGCETQC